jgi:hypothetical protein
MFKYNASMHEHLYICVYVMYEYICTHAFINACIVRMLIPCIYIVACMCLQMYAYFYAVWTRMYVFSTQAYIYICIYTSVFVCAYKQCKILYLRLELLSI